MKRSPEERSENPGKAGRLRTGSSPVEVEGAEPVDQKRWSAVKALVAVVAMSVLLIGGTVFLLEVLGDDEPEAALSLIFVSAAVVLIVVVCALTIVFRRLGLSNEKEAMGLPSGSVRAIIALLLIMLFFIAAVFLFNTTRNEVDASQTRTLTGITAERFALIPTDQIVSSTPRTAGDATVIDVVLFQAPSGTTTSDDIAKQLITTLGTLVTAIAAFYFGANSVEVAKKKLKDPNMAAARNGGTTAGTAGTGTANTPAPVVPAGQQPPANPLTAQQPPAAPGAQSPQPETQPPQNPIA